MNHQLAVTPQVARHVATRCARGRAWRGKMRRNWRVEMQRRISREQSCVDPEVHGVGERARGKSDPEHARVGGAPSRKGSWASGVGWERCRASLGPGSRRGAYTASAGRHQEERASEAAVGRDEADEEAAADERERSRHAGARGRLSVRAPWCCSSEVWIRVRCDVE